jgi:hypothetical protein
MARIWLRPTCMIQGAMAVEAMVEMEMDGDMDRGGRPSDGELDERGVLLRALANRLKLVAESRVAPSDEVLLRVRDILRNYPDWNPAAPSAAVHRYRQARWAVMGALLLFRAGTPEVEGELRSIR